MKLHLHYLPLHLRTVRLILSLGLASFAVQAGMAVVNFVLNNLLNMYGAMSAGGRGGARVYRRGAARGHVRGAAADRRVHRHPTAAGLQLRRAPVRTREEDAMVRHLRGDGHRFGAVGARASIPRANRRFFGITNESLRDFTVFASRCNCSCCLHRLPDRGLELLPGNRQPLKSIFLSLTRQILFLVPLLIVLPMVLPSWFPQFVSLDALYFATPAADFLAIFTTVVFIVLEMGRLKKLESGELKAKF